MSPSLLLAILLILASCCPQPATSRPHNNFTDLESLLAFKAHVTDPHGVLDANWTTNTSFCMWAGISCSRRRQRVTAIRLRGLSLHGTISPHVANLSFLSRLDLGNNTLTGPVPRSLGRLPRLTDIDLEENSLSGAVPSTIFNMSSLVNVYLGFNNLSGALPSNNISFTMLPRLKNISLSSNHFTGEIVASFARCRGLQMLSLSKNQFSNAIPAELGGLPALTLLYLGRNQLSGTIPASLGNLTKLVELDCGSNNLTGVIPNELGNLRNLQYLALANCSFIGSIPVELLNYSVLTSFDLSDNNLIGPVPAAIGKSLPLVNWFHIGGNQLSGGLEFLASLSACKNLQFLQIWGNELGGVLPYSIGNLSSSLQLFLAFENNITGNIPPTIGNISGLTFLSLHMNELTGTIPLAMTRLHNLQSMNLAFNRLTGLIPFEIGLMTSLNVIDLHYNALSGPIPDSLANITRIQYIWLHNNKLSSSLPESLWTLGSLLHLYLSANALNGSLSPGVGNLMALILLDLSMNQLSGKIPDTLGALQMLANLDLSRNSFEDQIPETFGGLISIIDLNLSHNFLSGAIPDSLANLSYLDHLDLSFNMLEGKIPNGRVFSNLSIPSLIGNEAICGALQLHLPPCSGNVANDNSRRKLQSLKYIIPLTVFGVVLFTCLCLKYAFNWRRQGKTQGETNLTNFDDYPVFSHHELVRATSNFNEANLLGRGGFGSVFKGWLDNGTAIAVKVLNLDVEGALKSFDAECHVLRAVRHRNLIKIISVCSNLDFKALVLEFMLNGNLEQWLYSDNYFLGLLQRLNIMIDVSMALEHLHHHHPHVVLHCDLKPTNVLLDEEMVAHLSDFGIAKLLLCDSRSITSATTPGTIGYIAPEYATVGTVSRMGDVYSFGILLLETFTGRKPIDAMFDENSNLREWVCKAQPNSILDVIDCKLRNDLSSNDGALHCLMSIIELGLLCSDYSPKKRIPMTDVAARLHKIKMKYLSNSPN